MTIEKETISHINNGLNDFLKAFEVAYEAYREHRRRVQKAGAKAIEAGQSDEFVTVMANEFNDGRRIRMLTIGALMEIYYKTKNCPFPEACDTFLTRLEKNFIPSVMATMAMDLQLKATGECSIHGKDCPNAEDHFPSMVDENLKPIAEETKP